MLDNSAENWAEWSVCCTEEKVEKDVMVEQVELPNMVPWDELLEETSLDPVLTELKNAIASGYFRAQKREF